MIELLPLVGEPLGYGFDSIAALVELDAAEPKAAHWEWMKVFIHFHGNSDTEDPVGDAVEPDGELGDERRDREESALIIALNLFDVVRDQQAAARQLRNLDPVAMAAEEFYLETLYDRVVARYAVCKLIEENVVPEHRDREWAHIQSALSDLLAELSELSLESGVREFWVGALRRGEEALA